LITKGNCQQNRCCTHSKKGSFEKLLSCKYGPYRCPEIVVRKCVTSHKSNIYEKIKCCRYLQRGTPEGGFKFEKILSCREHEKCKVHTNCKCPNIRKFVENIYLFEKEVDSTFTLIYKKLEVCEKQCRCSKCCGCKNDAVVGQ